MILQGRTALVTGGGTGIGRAAAEALAREGAWVGVCGRTLNPLKQTIGSIRSAGGSGGCLRADLGRPADIRRIAAWLEKTRGRLDLLINNAGILGPRVAIARYPPEEWDRVLRINLTAVFRLIQALLPLMLKAGGGSIINLSSTVGRAGRANWGAYAVSKFGLEGLTQVLAEELRPAGIRVNTLNPGATRTAMRAAAYPEEDPASLPSPESLGPAFVYLASDASRDLTGRALNARELSPPPA